MMYRIKILFLLIFLFPLNPVSSQDHCTYSLKGIVLDIETNEPLIGAAVWIEKINRGVASDENGEFVLSSLCEGEYVLTIHYLGYEELTKKVTFNSNKFLKIFLQPADQILNEVTVQSKKEEFGSTKTGTTVDIGKIEGESGKPIGKILEGIPGVDILRTGPTILKPMIHGLHSNRIMILNNGVRQEGQQWGSEHAPEIDPFMASTISVLKGAEVVRYGSDAIAGLIMVEPPELHRNAEFGGELILGGMMNSRMGYISGLLEGSLPSLQGLSWRIQGTIKQAGDSHAADYNLSNTGLKENNFSTTIGYEDDSRDFEMYYSRFDTELGIMSASHIGNLTDLEEALQSDEPLIMEPFTYKIENPKQEVIHDLIKVSGTEKIDGLGTFNFKYGGQVNRRKEFDNRRGGRLDKPSIDMKLNTHNLDLSIDHEPVKVLDGEAGVALSYQANRNIPGTGVEPLIPYYDEYKGSIFLVEKIIKPDWELEGGLRYDLLHLLVKDFNAADELVKPEYDFSNFSITVGGFYQLTPSLSVRSNIGTGWRQPNVAELYSRGLHHGIAGIEEGLLVQNGELMSNIENTDVNSEKSVKWVTTGILEVDNLTLQTSFYSNWIDDFIYLEPSAGEYRLTVRGAFPVFEYTQTDVNLTGIDGGLGWRFVEPLSLNVKGSMIRAKARFKNDYLIWMPADRIESSIRWEQEKLGPITEFHFSLGLLRVSRQTRVPPESDFKDPPLGYFLVNLHTGFQIPINNKKIGVYFNIDNLLNTSYRDYLNRFRYFADDLGRNFTLKLKYDFHAHTP